MPDKIVGYCKGTVTKFGMCSHCTSENCEDFFTEQPVEIIEKEGNLVPKQIEEIQMLEQPLLTEEGFLNEACMNELTAAIANMPETYERLKGNSEWTQHHWTFRKEIVATFAHAAVELSPVVIPDKLESVLKYLNECLKLEFQKPQYKISVDSEDLTEMVPLTLCEINKLLWDILGEEDVMKEWNTAPEENRSAFIDIHALYHYVCLLIRNDRRCTDNGVVNPDGTDIKEGITNE